MALSLVATEAAAASAARDPLARWHSVGSTAACTCAPDKSSRVFPLVRAEAVGFEPTGPARSPRVFKTRAFGRSATPPSRSVGRCRFAAEGSRWEVVEHSAKLPSAGSPGTGRLRLVRSMARDC